MHRSILLLGLLTLPMAAQEHHALSLVLDQQPLKKQSLGPADDHRVLEPSTNRGLGLRYAYTGWNLGTADLAITGAMRFSGKSDLRVTEDSTNRPVFSAVTADYAVQSMALGATLTWHLPAEVSLGAQWRQERLEVTSKDGGDQDRSTYHRPWLTASIGHTFQAVGGLKPFVALGAALPLTHTDAEFTPVKNQEQSKDNLEKLVRSLAPTFELSLSAGIRF